MARRDSCNPSEGHGRHVSSSIRIMVGLWELKERREKGGLQQVQRLMWELSLSLSF